jgi:hypothetical protein
MLMQFLSEDKYKDVLIENIILGADFKSNIITKYEKMNIGECGIIYSNDLNIITLLKKIDTNKFFSIKYELKEYVIDKYFLLIREWIERFKTKLKIENNANYQITLDDAFWKILRSDSALIETGNITITHDVLNYDNIEDLMQNSTFKKLTPEEIEKTVSHFETAIQKFITNLRTYFF